jgi:hypothetical protein
MKKHYLNPSLEVVEIQQQCKILSDSSKISDIEGNTDIDYGGGGHVEPMARKSRNEWEEDEEGEE